MEITLDKRYEVSDASAVKPTAKAAAKATDKPTGKATAKATDKPTGKATAAESTQSQEEKPDENGWTQSQQKALER